MFPLDFQRSLGKIKGSAHAALGSPRLDILKTVILGTYFSILTVLSIYGAHRLWMLILYYLS